MDRLERAKSKYRQEGITGLWRSVLGRLFDTAYVALVRLTLLIKRQSVIERNGVLLDLDQPRMPHSRAIILGNYEKPEMALIRSYVDGATDIVELGGGIGYTSCYLSNLLCENADQIVLEANPDLIPVITHHRELNDCSFEIYNLAYSAEAKSIDFHLQEDYLSSSAHRDGETIEVDAIDVATLAEDHDLECFTLVVDIEGSEQELINVELQYLKQNCTKLIVEFHYDVGPEIQESKQRLQRNSFELIDSVSTSGGRFEVCVFNNVSID